MLMRPGYARLQTHALSLTGSWVGTNILRWTPPTLINPLEPGTEYEDGFPGRGRDRTPFTNGFRVVTVDASVDLLVALPANGGGIGNGIPDGSASLRVGRLSFVGGQNCRIVGGDISTTGAASGLLFTFQTGSKSFCVEGVRGDFSAGPEADVCFFTGVTSGDKPDFYLMCGHFRGYHGTYAQHDAGRVVGGASVASGVMTVTGISVTVPTTITVGQELKLGGTSNSAFDNDLLVQTVGSTSVTAISASGKPLPVDGLSATGGTLWAVNSAVLGLHADGVQAGTGGAVANLFMDLISFKGNYDAGVFGRNSITGRGVDMTYLCRTDFTRIVIHPQEAVSFAYLFGDYDTPSGEVGSRAGARYAGAEIYDSYVQGQPWDIFTNSSLPQKGRYVDGIPMGARIEWTDDRRLTISWPQLSDLSVIVGSLTQGRPAGGDWAVWGTPGVGIPGYGYQTAGYADRSATPPAITDITLTGTTYAADDARGTVIGQIEVPYEDGWIIDVNVVNPIDVAKRAQVSLNKVEKGIAPYDGGSYDLELEASVRGAVPPVTFSKTFSLTCTTASSPAYGSMSDADAVKAVRAMYAYDTFVTADLDAVDDLFVALKAAVGGSYSKHKGLFVNASYDERDIGFNWFDTIGIEVLQHKTPKSWTRFLGYCGNPVADGFYITQTGFTFASLGLTQNSCSLMAGVCILAPGTTPGQLPTGTEYDVGVDNFFLGVTTTGRVTSKSVNPSTKNCVDTPFFGTSGNMIHMGTTRVASSGYHMLYGPRSTAMTIDNTSAVTGASSASQTPSTYDMYINGRGGPTTNRSSQTLVYTYFGLGLTDAEMDAVRAALDTYFDYIDLDGAIADFIAG